MHNCNKLETQKMENSATSRPHVALFPSAGMGHLTPFLRIASMLLSHNCVVTLITTESTVSVTESTTISSFLSEHPEINHIQFQVPPIKPSNSTTDDPFFIQFEATSKSAHLIRPLIAPLSPPLSAIFSDLVVASGVNKVASDVGIPNYVVSTTSASFLSLIAHLPILTSKLSTEANTGLITPLPISSIPPPFFNPDHSFTSSLVTSAKALPYCNGIIMNTFEYFEADKKALISNLPPILPIGPLQTYELKQDSCCRRRRRYLTWLNDQLEKSVVFVSFGSRTAMSKDQIRELRDGLEKCGFRFLWILKTKKVDKDEDEDDDLEEILGSAFLERTERKGMVLREWVSQQDVLAHPAIGGFVSHCGWNSVMEAAERGVPVVAWPQHGDQRVNAEVLEKAGLGIWDRTWGWGGQRLVKQDEIQKKIIEIMRDEKLKSRAKKVGEEARKAIGNGGSSSITFKTIIQSLINKPN